MNEQKMQTLQRGWRRISMGFMFLVAFLMMSTVTFVSSATDDVISCPDNSTDEEEVESSAMNILSVCWNHLNTSVTWLEEGVRILSLDGAFFHHEIALEILYGRQFWVTYCRVWPEFESCALDALRNCTSSEIELLRKVNLKVKNQILKIWRSIGLFPVPVIEKWACNGPELSVRLQNVYSFEKSRDCDLDLVKKCLMDWRHDLLTSGFLEALDESLINETDWLIGRARLTLNCSRMSLKPCSNKKVVEFANFVIKQSIPLEISKQMMEFDDVDKNEEMTNTVHNEEVKMSSSSSSFIIQMSKVFFAEVWIIVCIVQIVERNGRQ